MYDSHVEPVKAVQFSLLSSDDIRSMSVMNLTSTESYQGNTPVPNGMMSLKMGADANHRCATCHQTQKHCPGHPGRIELAKPVFSSIMMDTTVKILRSVCFRCSRLLYHPSHPEMASVMRLQGQRRFEALLKLISKSSTVKARCGNANPHGCGALQPVRINKQFINDRFMRVSMELAFEDIEGASTTGEEETGGEKLSLTAEDVLTILSRIPDEDIVAMGLHPKHSRPENMIIQTLLVPPPAVRPSHQSALLQRSENDITIVLSNIIKANNNLKNRIQAGKTIEPNDVYLGLLQYHVATMMDNDVTGLAPSTQRTGRSIVSIAQRLKTKEGRVRGNLLGKRVDASARCVITPDPYISIDEFGVPLKVATNITFPEVVTERNMRRLQAMVDNGPNNYPGARFVDLKRGDRTVALSPEKKAVILEIGDVVQRHIMDGDYLLFNRQPTLHKMSMMAHRARIMEGNTFRLNPCCTSPYNADFDGDELNAHMPISAHTMCEIASLAAVPVQILSPRQSSPVIGIVQDVALGVYEITNDSTKIDKYLYANLMCSLPLFPGSVPRLDEYTGNSALSAAIPPTVNMTRKNSSYNDSDPTDPKNARNLVKIEHGEISGVVDKETYGAGTTGVIHHVFNELGPKATVDLLDSTQRIVCDWFKHRGFSVGLSDLVISSEAKAQVESVIKDTKQEVYDVIADVHSGKFTNSGLTTRRDAFESQVSNLLAKARENATKIGNQQIGEGNRMMSMINSKSKGNKVNVVQMIATLGQQIADGKRPSYGFDNRTLPHYYKYDDGPDARGFVENSFITGLSPSEFFFHSTGGREGLMDTAVKSVTYDTEIIILDNGIPKRVRIGEWIDQKMSTFPYLVTHHKEQNLDLLDLEDTIYIPTTDYDGNVSWDEVTALTRHDPGESLYKITTELGRSVTVTAGKSLLIWQPDTEQFKEIETPNVSIGDLVPLTASLPEPPSPNDPYSLASWTKEQGFMIGMALAENGKSVHPDTFFAPTKFVKSVLDGYLDGKTTKFQPDHIQCTGNHRLLEGIAMLMTRIDVVADISNNSLRVSGIYKTRLLKALDKWKTSDSDESITTKNDVVLDKITNIEIIKPGKLEKVYDLTIPTTLNFGLANGLQVRDTSESGYLQRKLIKAMEDCKISTDHTVRNAAGHIVQFQYGEDGMDSVSIESQKLFHLEYDNDKTVSEFLITTADPLDTYLTAATLKKFLSDVKWEDFDEHVRDILVERRELISETFQGSPPGSINYPVAFHRIINNAMKRQQVSIPKGTPSDLNPIYSLDKLNKTIPTLVITSDTEPCLFIRSLMRTYLSPKQVMKLGMTKETFDDVYETIIDRFFESIAHPGEMVGIVAAQSIGEPTTQLTLNTFHSAGIESASRATRGLPRVKELLSVSKNPKQVVLTASLIPGFRENIDEANKVRNDLETTYLSHVVTRSSVYFDPKKFSTNIEEDKELVEAYRLFDRADENRSPVDVSPWVVRLEISKAELLERGLTMFDLSEAINDFYRDTVCCMFSDDNSDQLVFRIRLTAIASSGTSTDMLTDIRAFELSMLESVIIKGGFGVSNAIPMKKHSGKAQCFDESIGEFVKCDMTDEWVLETDGRDLSEIMAHPMVVAENTITNDITEVWNTLGIEAARAALLHELQEVMKDAYANPRHFLMLVDVMCSKGVLTSVDRHGLNRGDSTGPLAKASFEETIDIIRNAGIFAEVDNVNSVAASIMLGQVVNAGTGGAKIRLDEGLIGGLPEYVEQEILTDVPDDVSDHDICKAILRFLYTDPARPSNPIQPIKTPKITFA